MMDFDKKTIAAFVLIGLILIFIQTDFYQRHLVPGTKQDKELVPDSPIPPDTPDAADQRSVVSSREQGLSEGTLRAGTGEVTGVRGSGDSVVVETNLYRAVFSTQGASLQSWMLKEYFLVDGRQVELVGEPGLGNFAALIPTHDDTLDTGPLVFNASRKRISLNEKHPVDSVEFVLVLDGARELRKTYTFFHDRYDIRLLLELRNLDNLLEGYSYALGWRSGLRATEPDLDQDMSKAFAYAYQGDVEQYDAGSKFDPKEWDHPTDWVAIRTKYFVLAVLPESAKAQGVKFYSEKKNLGQGNKEPWKKYGFDLQMPLENKPSIGDNFTIYLGPLSYDLLTSYEAKLEDMMDLGGSIFRPFGKFILWCFVGLRKFIPNYGFVIVVFSILIKIVLYPLTKKSYQSMKEMQTLQPLMQEINEKHKNDPQKKQQEIMSLYKEHGINPLGGCLPMLLQLPLLYALFQVFQSTIQLRQAEFIWWIKDLSRPDTVAHLPFSIPLYGDTLNILPLFMGVTMFIQQKMSIKDPKQKAMVYIMPVFFTLLFNSFPSGLNLYYALFNVFSIAQEKLIPYHPKKPEELKQSKVQKKRIKHDYRGRYYK